MSLVRLALYQPDIAQNTGTMLRLCACLGIGADIIEPAGFPVTDRHFRRAGMDYLAHVHLKRHASFTDFEASRALLAPKPRLILLTTQADQGYTDFSFAKSDILLVGRESAGVPQGVHTSADARIHIPMQKSLRSLNVAVAASMAIGEALRQLGGFSNQDL